MKHVSVVLAALVATSALAEDIASRVAKAKALASTVTGQRYEQAIASVIHKAMLSCIAPGTTDKANLGKFVLVGQVTPEGALTEVDFEPQSTVAQCFAKNAMHLPWPAPPERGGNAVGYPIEVSMQVAP